MTYSSRRVEAASMPPTRVVPAIPSRSYRNYLLFVLLLVLTFSFADRIALGLALQIIKRDLHLSDTRLGLLSGIALAAFQAVAGVPMARWVDCGNRVRIVSVAAALWGVMVALTGRATNFGQLFLARMGVGVGDAGFTPSAQSLIPDYFARAERPRAAAVYLMAWPASLLLGYLAVGWLIELFGWRTMFAILGLPGFVLAALAWSTLREPRRRQPTEETGGPASDGRAQPGAVNTTTSDALTPSSHTVRAGTPHPTVKEVFKTLWQNATYRNLLLGYAVVSFFTAGVFQWQPAFFMRTFGMKPGEVGTWLAITVGAGSVISIYTGGALASRYAANNERLQFRVMAAAYLAFGIDHVLAYSCSNAYLAFILLGLGSFIAATSGPIMAACQTLVPGRMRGMSIAVLSLFTQLIGSGLGPLAVGMLSEALHPAFGRQSLRYALIALCPGFAWGAWYMWRASRTVTNDLAVI